MINLSASAEKKLGFEFVIYRLIEWSKTSNQIEKDEEFNRLNDFTKLKVLKLHFFVSAINSDKNSLLNLFNCFYAMPFGHVESDLYNFINSNSLENYEFVDNRLLIRSSKLNQLATSFGDLKEDLKNEIDESLDSLKAENFKLINYRPLELVDLSHMWFSWKAVFDVARSNDKYSEKIPAELIKNEHKIFLIPG